MFGKGISASGDLLDLAAGCDIISKSGAWYAYGDSEYGSKIGQGRDNAKKYLEDHPDIFAEIEEKVRRHYGIGTDTPKSPEEAVS